MDIECSFIYNIEHRSSETRKRCNDFLVQVRNLLLPLSLKVLRHKERDTHSFSSGFSIYAPPSRAAPVERLTSKRKSTLFVRCPVLNSTNWLCQISQILRTLPVHDVIHIHWSTFLWDFLLTFLNDTSSPSARKHLHSSLHLTNRWAEPKGS